MKILFLFPYPQGLAASQRFRFEQYLPALESAGMTCDLRPFLNEATWKIFYKRGFVVRKAVALLAGIFRRFGLLMGISKYDFIFLHREAMPVGPPILEWLITRVFRKKLIYDFDDAIWISNSSESNRFFSVLKFHSNVFKICRMAYKVSVGNDYLAEAVRPYNPSVVRNPTTIDTERLHNQLKNHDSGEPVIGWTGSHSTVKYLDPFFPVLRNLKERHPVRFIVISDETPVGNEDLFEFIPWNRNTEIADLLKFNIGVMPLSHDPWSEGKCGFKALQYMALGMPALVSPVGVNAEIVQDGINGFVCTNEKEWLTKMLQLTENKELLRTMGQAARKRVEEAYSVKSNTPNFLHLFR